MAVPVWKMDQITDPKFLDSLKPQVENLFGKVRLELADGVLEVSIRQAFINLFFWKILVAFNMPIMKHHFVKRTAFNNDRLMEALTPYYEEIIQGDRRNAKKLKLLLWDLIQELYFFTCTELLAYTCTIDILSLSRIVHDKEIAPIIETKKEITSEKGSDLVEKHIEYQNKIMMKKLGTPGLLSDEQLLPYQAVGQLNKFQLPQILYAYGYRTDVSDSIVGYPVQGSAIDGLRNVLEYAVESLSAKKSAFYNHQAVSDSQYFGRKQHLLAATLERIYNTDCGSNVLVKYNVTEKNYENTVGKLIYENGKPLHITYDNVKSFIGKTIHMRSPMTCRYRQGICETCGGLIYRNINRKYNIGILSAIHVIEPTTQKILSSKHLIKTNSIIYQLPHEASEYLVPTTISEIRWKPALHNNLKNMYLGIPIKYFASVHDVKLLRFDKIVKEERFSKVSSCVLRTDKTKVAIPLESEGQIPFLSTEMLLHIRDHFNDLTFSDNTVWIPLEHTEKFPIFKTAVVNDNMLQFVDRVSGFLSKDIAEYTSCHEALQDFSDLIHDKVSANLTHLEALLKAYEITSHRDYRIPIVEDADNVIFETTTSIMNNRNVGGLLAFQGLNKYLCQPSSYLVRKMRSPWDGFIGSLD